MWCDHPLSLKTLFALGALVQFFFQVALLVGLLKPLGDIAIALIDD